MSISTSIELRLVSREGLFLDAKVALNWKIAKLVRPKSEFLPRWD